MLLHPPLTSAQHVFDGHGFLRPRLAERADDVFLDDQDSAVPRQPRDHGVGDRIRILRGLRVVARTHGRPSVDRRESYDGVAFHGLPRLQIRVRVFAVAERSARRAYRINVRSTPGLRPIQLQQCAARNRVPRVIEITAYLFVGQPDSRSDRPQHRLHFIAQRIGVRGHASAQNVVELIERWAAVVAAHCEVIMDSLTNESHHVCRH